MGFSLSAHAFDEPRTGIDIVYTDFRKAFDSVPHQRLLLKLRNYGIHGRLHRWLGSFLTHRLQRVILNGTYSDWARVISGVPQGTILGPLLFLFYINDLPDHVKSTAKMFADDCKIYTRIANTSDCVTLQDDLNSLSAWSRKWLLGFSKEKCVVMRVKKALDFIYCIDGHALEYVSEQKDLGVTISNDLKPSKHVDSIVKKANQRLGMIRRCFTNRSANVIVPIYTSLIRPILETYSAWNPWLKKDIDALERVQRRCEKLCSESVSFVPLSVRRYRRRHARDVQTIKQRLLGQSRAIFPDESRPLEGTFKENPQTKVQDRDTQAVFLK